MSASLPDLSGRHVILGVTGSIAAYKSALLVRLLKKAGVEVQVLMTPGAERFVSPLTLGTLSEREVLTEIFPENEDGSWTKHVTLGQWADLFVVAPATAQTVAKLARGFCDSMLTATALSARCPLLVCPTMDRDMYRHAATQDNLKRLREIGYAVMPAEHGELASGLVGKGRMPEPASILERGADMIGEYDSSTNGASDPEDSLLTGSEVLVTAGPTREPLDPVRVLTNPSTGTMGYALAEAAAQRGASVTLVSGPTTLDPPPGAEVIHVQTAEEMNEAVQARRDTADYVFMAAAVADYTPADPSSTKRKKEDTDEDLVLHLRRTPDILKTLGARKRPDQVLVGFALETDDALENARRKLEEKNLDWIAVNNPTEEGAGFGPTNRVTLLRRDGPPEELPLMPKADVAEALLDRVLVSHQEQG
ncbi:MAG: bifunctional phosphopantothenoylcysteine decarboxylase/phosphopantothenate--cysteine ligase CoaBC [Bacteroidetes bacterium QH_7_64_110]|nr:MAG: bifunctional phosphopantothenoylcysteine decarboxylase/phosphopantothenate--cysteine ligase CoaBC [Bacteroidetes bacterium QH_7_64_110]